jgi:FKBP-type peptidyl-prolyl cis-trans isomerase FklB
MMLKNTLLSLFLPVLLSACASTPVSQNQPASHNNPGISDAKQSGYGLGLLAIKVLREGKFKVDQASFEQGLKDGLAGKLPEETDAEKQSAKWQQLAKLHDDLAKTANLAAGKTFLEHNRTRPNVVSLPSGLQYEILKAGKGKAKPMLTDTVGILYKISGIDGSVKINTMEKHNRKMYEILLQKIVSKGWQEAIQLMTQGSQWRLFIPAELAFGENGLSEKGILPNETLVIETHLERVVPASQ